MCFYARVLVSERYIIDYCELGSLNILHHKMDMRRPEIFKTIAKDVINGLRHLHNHDVVHRDIACRNLFMRKDGSVVLGDLGLTRKLKDRDRGYTATNWKLPWRWMPPEIFVPADGRLAFFDFHFSFFLKMQKKHRETKTKHETHNNSATMNSVLFVWENKIIFF